MKLSMEIKMFGGATFDDFKVHESTYFMEIVFISTK
jgi:hypothetical protein